MIFIYYDGSKNEIEQLKKTKRNCSIRDFDCKKKKIIIK